MNNRGVTEAPSAFGGVVFEVLILILILYVAFAFLKAGLFPEDKKISLENFNALVMKVEALINEPAEFVAGEFSLTLEDQYTIVGFNKQEEVFETCGDPDGDILDSAELIEKISKPASCGDKACLCLYKDDTKLGNADNLDFNAAIENGYQQVISCRQLGADYIFSHPYSIFKGSSYHSASPEWKATTNEMFNTLALNAADEEYYHLGLPYYDYVRNFRGYLFQGPNGFNFGQGFKYVEFKNGETTETKIPDPGFGYGASNDPSKLPKFLWYFENNAQYYTWCQSKGYKSKQQCLEELKKYGRNNVPALPKRAMTEVYSSFVLYGECEANHPDLNKGEFKVGALYFEKYADPATGKISLFVGLPSPYTSERADVMRFFTSDKSPQATTASDKERKPLF